jgi:PncC family amidohydrolase
MTPHVAREPVQQLLLEARRLADIVHGRLVELGDTVGVAESLTGGMIRALLTEAPGTSVTFRGGLVVYCTDLKHTVAGVRTQDIDQFGPVHGVIAEQLATGALRRLEADYGVGVTGVAGQANRRDAPSARSLLPSPRSHEPMSSDTSSPGIETRYVWLRWQRLFRISSRRSNSRLQAIRFDGRTRGVTGEPYGPHRHGGPQTWVHHVRFCLWLALIGRTLGR